MDFLGHHDLYFYWSPFCFILEPQDESSTHSNGQVNDQVCLPYGKYPSRIGNFHSPLSRPHSVGGFTPSWKCCAPYHNDPPVIELAPTGCCCEALASSQSCKNVWDSTSLTLYLLPPFCLGSRRGSFIVLYKSIIFPSPSNKTGV